MLHMITRSCRLRALYPVSDDSRMPMQGKILRASNSQVQNVKSRAPSMRTAEDSNSMRKHDAMIVTGRLIESSQLVWSLNGYYSS